MSCLLHDMFNICGRNYIAAEPTVGEDCTLPRFFAQVPCSPLDVAPYGRKSIVAWYTLSGLALHLDFYDKCCSLRLYIFLM